MKKLKYDYPSVIHKAGLHFFSSKLNISDSFFSGILRNGTSHAVYKGLRKNVNFYLYIFEMF